MFVTIPPLGEVLATIRYRPAACGRYEGGVLCDDPAVIPRGGRLPRISAVAQLLFGNLEVEQILLGIDRYGIALLYQCDGASNRCFGSNMPHDHPVGAPRKPAIGYETYCVPKSLADEG